MTEPEFCPVHGVPNDPLQAWPCPLVFEGDPPDKQNCVHFEDELERRKNEIAEGNFYELTPYDEDGNRWFVGYGKLAGERNFAWSRSQVDQEGDSNS